MTRGGSAVAHRTALSVSGPIACSLASPNPANRTQGRLLSLAVVFLFFYALALSLSPAARLRTWDTQFRWDHWLGFGLWLVFSLAAHFATARRLPDRDPYLLPAAALLSGWGCLRRSGA